MVLPWFCSAAAVVVVVGRVDKFCCSQSYVDSGIFGETPESSISVGSAVDVVKGKYTDEKGKVVALNGTTKCTVLLHNGDEVMIPLSSVAAADDLDGVCVFVCVCERESVCVCVVIVVVLWFCRGFVLLPLWWLLLAVLINFAALTRI